MGSLQQAQDALERALGAAPLPFHLAFWRGRSRDEVVGANILGRPLIVVGRPRDSLLIQLLKGEAPSSLRAVFGPLQTQASDLALLERWISEGCPEAPAPRGHSLVLDAGNAPTDEQHTLYWRAIDRFFHPSLASSAMRSHVMKWHDDALQAWLPTVFRESDTTTWPAYASRPEVAESFAQIRHHQRRILREYYGDSQSAIFDSFWKFGGNLLPVDPEHPLPPIKRHTMNGVVDWFWWVPYVYTTLTATDKDDTDLALARGWQLGIVADGLLRRDAERPQGSRLPISGFGAADAELRTKVEAKYSGADPALLINEMIRRGRDASDAGVVPL